MTSNAEGEVPGQRAGECVLVVGGTRGTGLLIARLLVRRGYRTRVLARDPARASAQAGPEIEVVAGDITKPGTLPAALEGADHIVFTAGVPSGRRAPESLVKATDYDGVLNTMAAARRSAFAGRFVYLNSIGIETRSIPATLLNFLKRNALVWRRRVERDIRASGLDYTIIRIGFLNNAAGGRRAIEVSQGALPLAPRNRIARADVAEVFVDALQHPQASRATFEIVWGKGGRRENPPALMDRLKPDAERRNGAAA